MRLILSPYISQLIIATESVACIARRSLVFCDNDWNWDVGTSQVSVRVCYEVDVTTLQGVKIKLSTH